MNDFLSDEETDHNRVRVLFRDHLIMLSSWALIPPDCLEYLFRHTNVELPTRPELLRDIEQGTFLMSVLLDQIEEEVSDKAYVRIPDSGMTH